MVLSFADHLSVAKPQVRRPSVPATNEPVQLPTEVFVNIMLVLLRLSPESLQVQPVIIIKLDEFLRSVGMPTFASKTFLCACKIDLVLRLLKNFTSNGYDDLRVVTAMSGDDLDEVGVPAATRYHNGSQRISICLISFSSGQFLKKAFEWQSQAKVLGVLEQWAQVLHRGSY